MVVIDNSILVQENTTKVEQQQHQQQEKAVNQVVRRIDWKLIPFLAASYFFSFLDRSNIANARISNISSNDNIEASLGLKDSEIQLAISIFFVGYIVFEVPSNLCLKRFNPSRWISRIMITWGLTAAAQGFVYSFVGLLICRILLGIFEAGFFPGVMFYLTFWYLPQETSFRLALFMISQPLSGLLGGVLAYLLSFMNGTLGLEGWRWIFILEGIPTVLLGIFCWTYIPDYPQTASFLSLQEKALIIDRLQTFGANSCNDSNLDLRLVKQVLKAPETYIFCLLNFLRSTPFYSFTYAFPKILTEMGYQDWKAQLLSSPPYLAALCCTLVTAYLSDKYNNRLIPILILAFVQVFGFTGMIFWDDVSVKYAFSFLAAIGNYSGGPPFLAWVINCNMGSTRTAIVSAMVIATGSLGGIVSPYLYPKAHAPLFLFGHSLNVGISLVGILGVLLVEWLLRRRRYLAESSL